MSPSTSSAWAANPGCEGGGAIAQPHLRAHPQSRRKSHHHREILHPAAALSPPPRAAASPGMAEDAPAAAVGERRGGAAASIQGDDDGRDPRQSAPSRFGKSPDFQGLGLWREHQNRAPGAQKLGAKQLTLLPIAIFLMILNCSLRKGPTLGPNVTERRDERSR